jgi:hypothetical protein
MMRLAPSFLAIVVVYITTQLPDWLINYEEFCRRGKLRQSGEAHAGMPDYNRGPAQQGPG